MSENDRELSDAERGVLLSKVTIPRPSKASSRIEEYDDIVSNSGMTAAAVPFEYIEKQNLVELKNDGLRAIAPITASVDCDKFEHKGKHANMDPQSKATENILEEKEDPTVTASKALSGWHGTKARFEKKDQLYMKDFDDEINALLVFAGLFSAILTAFIIEVYKTLQEDYTETSAYILRRISLQLANATLDETPLPRTKFHCSSIPQVVNVLWFSSLLLSIFAALFGIFVKQWLHTYGNWSLIGDPKDAVRVRQWYRRGMAKWRVETIVATLPLLLQLALVCFVAGLAAYLWTLNYVVAGFATALVLPGISLAIVAIVLPYWNPDCPYKSPLGLLLVRILRGTRHPHWRNHDLQVVETEWAKLNPAESANNVSQEMCVVLEIVPEVEESAHSSDLVKARVDELEIHQDPSSLETLCSLMTTHLNCTPGTFLRDAHHNIGWVLSALTTGTRYPMSIKIIQRLVVHAAFTTLISDAVSDMKDYIEWLHMVSGYISFREDSWKTLAIRDAATPLLQCVQQWHLSARSKLTSMDDYAEYIDKLDQSWSLLCNSLYKPALQAISLHSPVYSAASLPAGLQIITGHKDGSMTLLDGDTGKKIMSFDHKHTAVIYCMALSPSHTQLATGSKYSTIRIWDMKNGKCVKTLQGHTKAITGVAFSSPESDRLVSVSNDSTIRWWNIQSGTVITQITERQNVPLRRVVWSANGAFIALGLDSIISIRDAQSTAKVKDLVGHTRVVLSVEVSSNSQCVVSGGMDGTARIWDVSSGLCLQTLCGHTHDVNVVAFSEDCKYVVTGSDDRTVRTWDVCTGAAIRTFEGHSSWVRFAAFASDNRRVISGALDSRVCIWDGLPTVVCNTLAFSRGHNIKDACWALSSDGRYIASGLRNGFVHIWDSVTGKHHLDMTAHESRVRCLAFSQNGLRLLSVASNRAIKIWVTEARRDPQILNGHESRVNCAVFSYDGALVASGAEDKVVRLWTLDSGKCLCIMQGHKQAILCVAFAPDGDRLASGSQDHSIHLWDTKTGECVHKLTEHSDWVRVLAFSSDGLQVASGSDDRTVRLWDTVDGKCQHTLTGNTSYVFHVAFSTDGTCLMARGERGDWHVWNALYDFPSPLNLPVKPSAPLIILENDGWIVGRKHSQAPAQRLYWLIPERRGVMYVQAHRVFVDATHGFGNSYDDRKNTGIVTVLNFTGCI